MKFYRGLFFALLFMIQLSILIYGLSLFSVCHAEDTYDLRIKTSDKLPVNGIQWNDAYYKKCDGKETLNECIDRLKPEIDAERAVRLANADESISHPIVPPEPTEAELIAKKEELVKQLQDLTEQVTAETVEIDSKLTAISLSKIVPVEEKLEK